MAKRFKKKAGLHKKVSTVFAGVQIPPREAEPQTSQVTTSDGSCNTSPKSKSKVSLVSKSTLMKKVRRSKSSSNKTATNPQKRVLLQRKLSKHPASKSTRESVAGDAPTQTRQTKAKSNPAAPDRTMRVSEKPAVSDQPTPRRASAKKTRQTKSSADKASPDRPIEIPVKPKALDQSPQNHASAIEPSQAGDSVDKAIPKHTKEISEKLAAPDELIPKPSPAKKPEQNKDVSNKVSTDRTLSVVAKLPTLEHMIPNHPSAKKTRQAVGPSSKATPGRTTKVPPKIKAPDRLIPSSAPVEQTPRAEDSSDKAASERTIGIPSWIMSPDYPDSLWNPTDQPGQPEDLPTEEAESDRTDEVSRTAPEEPVSLPSLIQEPPQVKAKNGTDKTAPSRKSWVPPKLTAPDRSIPRSSSTDGSEHIENARDISEPAQGDVASNRAQKTRESQVEHAQHGSATEHSASQSARVVTFSRNDGASETSAPDRSTKIPPAPKSADPRTLRDSDSEQRYGPEAPPKEAESSEQPKTEVFPETSGPSRLQRIRNKLFKLKPSVNSARQRVMVMAIPILVIVLIFLFRQVLSKSPSKTKGSPAKDKAPIAVVDPNQEIDWHIPEPLPATMRDPTKLPDPSETKDEEQNTTTNKKKSELVSLGTIVYSHDRPSAIVNGRIVHVGEKVSGVTILKITRDSVEFEKNGEQWIQRVRD